VVLFLSILKVENAVLISLENKFLHSVIKHTEVVEISEVYPQMLWIETNIGVTHHYVFAFLTHNYVFTFLVLSRDLCGGLTLTGCQTSTQPLSPTQLFSHYSSSSGQGEKKI